MANVLWILLTVSFFGASLGVLEEKVTYYEVLTAHDIYARTRRSAARDLRHSHSHELTLTIFNMTLVCHLRPQKRLFAQRFRLVVVDGSKKSVASDYDKDQILEGTCEGDDASTIDGHFVDGVFEGTVKYLGVVYVLEEAKRHLREKQPGEHHGKMIAYRSSDMIWEANKTGDGPAFCGASHAEEPRQRHHSGRRSKSPTDSSSRVKRAAAPDGWSTCRMIAVADYKFYRFIGDRSIYTTANYIANVIENANRIFQNTYFSGTYNSGFGFEIAEMQIHVNPTSGYNADRADWDTLELLQSFGRDTYFKDFCVAHLFTHQQFSDSVLGQAYIADSTLNTAGGICSPTRTIDGQVTALNTGWSTTLNSNGDTVLYRQAQLVTAHELGHNWGSEHDPDTDSCSPSSLFGNGKYLMYAYAVSGYDSNNDEFSPCSREDIGAVLNVKAGSCFSETPDENELCGNGVIDAEEQCDAGYLGRFGLDPCCSSQCMFIGEATCSPVNHECCENCVLAPAGIQCADDTGLTCYNASYCDGINFACPTPPTKPNGSSCLDLGMCDGNGECLSFCEARGKFSCTCDEEAESCQRCCRDTAEAECKPYDSNYGYPLPNGRPCVVGICQNGVCEKTELSAVQRLFDILDDLDIDSVLEFFRDNLVGCVMVFSLFLWIPISCICSFRDRRMRRGLKAQVKVELREDRDLLNDEDGRRVNRPAEPYQSSTPRTPRSLAPRRLPPLMSPRNKELIHHKNRIMPVGGGGDLN